MGADAATGWATRSLADLVDERGITYGVVQPGKPVADGVPILRVSDFRGGQLDLRGVLRIDSAIAARHKRSRLRGGEVLMTIVGSVGLVAIAPTTTAGWNVARAVAVVPVADANLASWVALTLRSRTVLAGLSRHFNTTVQTTLNLRDLNQLAIAVPPKRDRDAICRVLGALDDKIESNRRLADASDAAWLSYAAHHLRDARSLHVETLLAEGVLVINDGYRAKNRELASEGIAFVRAGNLSDQGLDLSGADRVPVELAARVGAKRSVAWDTAFTSKGTVGRITLVDPDSDTFVYSPQVCFWRTVDRERLSPFVLHAWMRSARFTGQVDAVKGQTDMADYVSLRDQRAMRFDLPEPSVQRDVGELAEPLARYAAAARKEARTLTAIRDALLPKLVSGQIRVMASTDVDERIGGPVQAVA